VGEGLITAVQGLYILRNHGEIGNNNIWDAKFSKNIGHIFSTSFCNNSSFPHVVWIYITSVVAGFLSANHEGNE
jgi:hypothetical protein